MLISNTLETNQENQERKIQKKYGLIHPSDNLFQQTLQRHFFNWYQNIFLETTSFTKF